MDPEHSLCRVNGGTIRKVSFIYSRHYRMKPEYFCACQVFSIYFLALSLTLLTALNVDENTGNDTWIFPRGEICNILSSSHLRYLHTDTHTNICTHSHIRKGSEILQDKLFLFHLSKTKTERVNEFSVITKSRSTAPYETEPWRVSELVLGINSVKPVP